MYNPVNILSRSLVTPFYRQISGALAFIFFVTFGTQPNLQIALQTHYYIMLAIVKNTQAWQLFLLATILYALKCIFYLGECLSKNSYQFIFQVNAVNYRKRFLLLLPISGMLLLPVIIYGFMVMAVGLQSQYYLTSLNILGLLLAVTLTTAQLFIALLNKHLIIHQDIFSLLRLPKFPAGITSFLLSFNFNKQFKALLIVKLLSFFVLYYFVKLDATEFEARILWLIFMLVVSAHCVLIYKNFYFIENQLSLYRNMPIPRIRVVAALFLFYVLIFLPEAWALKALWLTHGSAYSYWCMVIGGPCILLFLHVLLYAEDTPLEGFIPLVFGVWLVFFFFSFSQNKWLIPVVALTGAIIVIYTSFASYEKKGEVEKLE